jgi:hypothetical protein
LTHNIAKFPQKYLKFVSTAEDIQWPMRWLYGCEWYANKDVEGGNHGPFQEFISVITYTLRQQQYIYQQT